MSITDGPTRIGNVWRCSCGADCPTHGIITLEDRMAAEIAGYQRGVAAGRMQAIEQDSQALALAAECLSWIRHRASAAAQEGESWAEYTAGPMPIGGDPYDRADA